MRKQSLLFVLLSLFALLLPFSAARAQDEVGDLLGRVNNLRAAQGLPAYAMSGALSAAAQSQAQWIADTGSVSHTRPDGSGPRTRALNAGYPSTEVSENIYGGTMANAGAAWTFWVNSGIHYAGLVHRRYREVGIGIARSGWGTAYVMVFGNPGGSPPFVAAPAAGGGSGGGGSAGVAVAAAPAPPSYVVGIDPRGNIMHEVQPGDTLGDIALIYGYTWDDLAYMMQINGLTDVRDLEVGSIFLVPPKDGTLTPSPVGDTPTPVGTARPTSTPRATSLVALSPTPPQASRQIATAAAAPETILLADATVEPVAAPLALAAPTEVALLPGTLMPQTADLGVTITRRGPSPWLGVALALQVAILAGAAFEFFRRARRRR